MNSGLSIEELLDSLKESKLLSEEDVQRASTVSSSSVDAPSLAQSFSGNSRVVLTRHVALAAIYSKYSEGFTTPDLVDAKQLLEELR